MPRPQPVRTVTVEDRILRSREQIRDLPVSELQTLLVSRFADGFILNTKGLAIMVNASENQKECEECITELKKTKSEIRKEKHTQKRMERLLNDGKTPRQISITSKKRHKSIEKQLVKAKNELIMAKNRTSDIASETFGDPLNSIEL